MCMYPQVVPSWTNAKGNKLINGDLVYNTKAKDTKNLMQVPCGKCPDCRKLRASQWAFRLGKENDNSFTSHFVTLTYKDECLPIDGSLSKEDQKKFLKKLRRQIDYLYNGDDPSFEHYGKHRQIMQEQYHRMKEAHWFKERRLKYYWVGEYGTQFGRPHYHAIMFNIPKPIVRKLPKIWKNGSIKVGNVTPKSIRYVANYVMQLDYNKERGQREYSTMSNKLGADFLHSNKGLLHANLDGTIEYNDYKIPMPRYYRDKVYNDEERGHIGRKNKNEYEARREETKQMLSERGIDYDEYIKAQNEIKINKFLKHKKVRKL